MLSALISVALSITVVKIEFVASKRAVSGMAVVPVFEKEACYGVARDYLKDGGPQVKATLKGARLSAHPGTHTSLYSSDPSKLNALTFWSAGEKKRFDAELFGAKAGAAFRTRGESSLTLHLDGLSLSQDELARAAVGVRLATYRFFKHRSKVSENRLTTLKTLRITCDSPTQARSSYRSFHGPICDGQLHARDLVNEPANILFPKAYATRIRALKKAGLEIEVLGEKEMKALKMNALLGVGQGSRRESQLVVMKWMGGKRKKGAPVCLVGKGITFDTGGISLKPGVGMWDMKGDMGGSAAVVGAMQALALRKAKVNAIGIVALAENMPDGNAQNPGDVITSMSGQTIELQSTDAEGRLVLADALWYAKKTFKPCAMVDLATLTGAVLVSLGHEHAGLFTNSDKLAKEFEKSSPKAQERTWRFPLLPEYDRLLDSETADMKNSVGRVAGSITAAQFLQRFVDGTPWVHLDIAGTSSKNTRTDPREPSFAIGYGVRLLNQWIADHYEG
ncbi:leucyl aminopeptidase [Haloferula sp.]|uniref:leucyl aminopeptidase n=1 Tax=Haloferula sp. TaxID=2497595 RepID=UPI00329D0ACB